jgi:hypothetical protein
MLYCSSVRIVPRIVFPKLVSTAFSFDAIELVLQQVVTVVVQIPLLLPRSTTQVTEVLLRVEVKGRCRAYTRLH